MARSLVSAFVVSSALSLVFAAEAQAVIMWGDLISYWKLDGDLNDSVGANHGTLNTGSPTFVTGADGTPLGALDLRAGGQFVQTGLQLDNSAKTMTLWMRSDVASPGETVWAGNSAVTTQRFYIGRRTASSMWIGGGTTVSEFPHPDPFDNTFHHFALVWDGVSTLSAYQNGNTTPIHSATISGSTATQLEFLIGAAGGSGQLPARAILDDVALFNRALTPAEIQSIFNAGSVEAAIPQPPVIPEPSSLALAVLGLLALLGRRRRPH